MEEIGPAGYAGRDQTNRRIFSHFNICLKHTRIFQTDKAKFDLEPTTQHKLNKRMLYKITFFISIRSRVATFNCTHNNTCSLCFIISYLELYLFF